MSAPPMLYNIMSICFRGAREAIDLLGGVSCKAVCQGVAEKLRMNVLAVDEIKRGPLSVNSIV